MEAIIETKHLTHTYSAGTPFERSALLDVDFSAYKGEYLGIIGHTGSGSHRDSAPQRPAVPPPARCSFRGRTSGPDPKRTRMTRFQVGLVFQYPEYQLFEETVIERIAFGPTNMGLDEKEIDRRVRSAAYFVGLRDDQLDKSPFQLSGGQKRRVAIAGVIAMEPKGRRFWTSPPPGLATRWAWSPFWATSGTTTRPRMPPSSWCPTPWRRWPGPVDRLVVVNDGKISLPGRAPGGLCPRR